MNDLTSLARPSTTDINEEGVRKKLSRTFLGGFLGDIWAKWRWDPRRDRRDLRVRFGSWSSFEVVLISKLSKIKSNIHVRGNNVTFVVFLDYILEKVPGKG